MKSKLTTSARVVSSLFLVFSASIYADPIPSWVNSYAADNQCFCASGGTSVSSTAIVPTPIGGQSVAQVCNRIGSGPSLTLQNGVFSYPVYTDAQCGNGPTVNNFSEEITDCEGRVNEDNTVCLGTGPEWDLNAAYTGPQESTTIVQESTVIVVESYGDSVQEQRELQVADVAEIGNDLAVEPTTEIGDERSYESQPTSIAELLNRSAGLSEQIETVNPVQEEIIQAEVAEIETVQPVVVEAPEIVHVPEVAQAPVTQTPVTQTPREIHAPTVIPAPNEIQVPQVAGAPEVTVMPEVAGVDAPDQPVQDHDSTEIAELIKEEHPLSDGSSDISKEEVAQVDTTPSSTTGPIEKIPPTMAAAKRAVTSPFRSLSQTRDFRYVQLSPIGYDFGGNGASVEGSFSSLAAWSVFGKAAVTQDYNELLVGVGYSFGITSLPKATVQLGFGVEHGEFDLGLTDYNSTGALLSASLGYRVSSRVAVGAGVGYSSFFEGDPNVYAMGVYQLMNNIDVAGRAEAGDNDNVGIGIRFRY